MLIKHFRFFSKISFRKNASKICNMKQICVSQRVYSFSSLKKKEGEGNDENITIQYTEEQLKAIKQILADKSGIPPQAQPKQDQQQSFFSNQQAKISFKIIQIDSIDQLKPLMKEYGAKLIPSSEGAIKDAQTIRSKFLIIYKFVNLGGSLKSKDIEPLIKDVTNNLKFINEKQLTVFYRIIANDSAYIPTFKTIMPKIFKLQNPSHINSELISLLLILYPEQKEEIYINYHLVAKKKMQSFKQGIQQPQKDVIYDPLTLAHMLSHYLYYEDIHKIFEATMKVKSLEDINCHTDIEADLQAKFSQRKIQALIYCIHNNLEATCDKYISSEYFDFSKFEMLDSINLINEILSSEYSKKIKRDDPKSILIAEILNSISQKQQALITDQQEQQEQNNKYKLISDIITVYLRKKQQFISPQSINNLMRSIFASSNNWRRKFQLYSHQDLFSLIVCYKASKDYIATLKKDDLDERNIIFGYMITAYHHLLKTINQIDQKGLFYVCLFSSQLSSLHLLKSDRVISQLQKFQRKKQLNANVKNSISNILQQLKRP